MFNGFELMLVARCDDCLIAFGGFWLRVVVAYGVVLWCLAVLGSVWWLLVAVGCVWLMLVAS